MIASRGKRTEGCEGAAHILFIARKSKELRPVSRMGVVSLILTDAPSSTFLSFARTCGSTSRRRAFFCSASLTAASSAHFSGSPQVMHLKSAASGFCGCAPSAFFSASASFCLSAAISACKEPTSSSAFSEDEPLADEPFLGVLRTTSSSMAAATALSADATAGLLSVVADTAVIILYLEYIARPLLWTGSRSTERATIGPPTRRQV